MHSIFQFACLLLAIHAARSLPLITQYDLVQSPTFFSAQPLQTQPVPGILYPQEQQRSIAHPAVEQNALAESQYPPELLNNQYKNPLIAERLAKESWFTNKEFPVHHREAEKISRQKIYEIVDRIVNH